MISNRERGSVRIDGRPIWCGTLGVALSAAVLLLAGCSDILPPPPPSVHFTMEEVAGSYEATRMDAIETTTGEVTDLLAAGAEFELTLTDDGRTAGQLFLPEEARVFEEDPQGDLLIDLAGTYTILETDPVLRFEFESSSILGLDLPSWSISEEADGDLRIGADRGLVGNDRDLRITLTRE